jgi:hypothetical protein
MSLYRKHAQGDTVKDSSFDLTRGNIDQYMKYAVDMHESINWINHLNDIQYKLDHIDELDDDLYTEEYLNRRLEKIKSKRQASDADVAEIREIKRKLAVVNSEIDEVKPLVFDKIEGQKEEHHIRMSDLNDRRKELEEEINEFYGRKYSDLKTHMPKVYYMIIDGVDIMMVQSCFMKMKSVLLGEQSVEEAANTLMDESTSKYNLPSTIWDPIRSKKQGGKKNKKKK